MDDHAKAFTDEDPKEDVMKTWYETEKDPKQFKDE